MGLILNSPNYEKRRKKKKSSIRQLRAKLVFRQILSIIDFCTTRRAFAYPLTQRQTVLDHNIRYCYQVHVYATTLKFEAIWETQS